MGKFFKIVVNRNSVDTFSNMWNMANKYYKKAVNIGDRRNVQKYNDMINRLKTTDMFKSLNDVDLKTSKIINKLRAGQLKN